MSYSNCNCTTFNKETRSALKESARTAIAEGSYSERLKTDKNGDVYIRSFLVNDKVNDRGWSLEPNQNILSILGKPLIRYRDPISLRVDHYPWRSWRSAEGNIKAAENHAIGRVVSVLRGTETGNFYVDVKISDKAAKEYIKSFSNSKIPIAVSPQLTYSLDGVNTDKHYKNYNFTHLAIVEPRGAYGPDARVLDICSGDHDSCKKQFESQNQNTIAAAAAASMSSLSAEAAAQAGFEPTRHTPGYHYLLKQVRPTSGKAPRKLA
jgi:hypothetical protein